MLQRRGLLVEKVRLGLSAVIRGNLLERLLCGKFLLKREMRLLASARTSVAKNAFLLGALYPKPVVVSPRRVHADQTSGLEAEHLSFQNAGLIYLTYQPLRLRLLVQP